jgi:hypothetical protein
MNHEELSQMDAMVMPIQIIYEFLQNQINQKSQTIMQSQVAFAPFRDIEQPPVSNKFRILDDAN